MQHGTRDLKFVVRGNGKIWQVRDREFQINSHKKYCNTHHYGVVIDLLLFRVFRLMPQEGAAWDVGFETHGWREWQKMAGQEQWVTIK